MGNPVRQLHSWQIDEIKLLLGIASTNSIFAAVDARVCVVMAVAVKLGPTLSSIGVRSWDSILTVGGDVHVEEGGAEPSPTASERSVCSFGLS